jgi:hypothetical protein
MTAAGIDAGHPAGLTTGGDGTSYRRRQRHSGGGRLGVGTLTAPTPFYTGATWADTGCLQASASSAPRPQPAYRPELARKPSRTGPASTDHLKSFISPPIYTEAPRL